MFYLLLCTLILLLLLHDLLLVAARQSGVSLESCHLALKDSGQAVKIMQEKIKVCGINRFQTATAMLSSTHVLQKDYLLILLIETLLSWLEGTQINQCRKISLRTKVV